MCGLRLFTKYSTPTLYRTHGTNSKYSTVPHSTAHIGYHLSHVDIYSTVLILPAQPGSGRGPSQCPNPDLGVPVPPPLPPQRWVSDFERLLMRMWAIHCQGKGPCTFRV